MKTKKLYYEDPYLGRFTAKVLKSEIDEEGRNFVVLDQTAFYPTGGGQPHDTGTINNLNVTNVEEIDGEIRHYVPDTIDVGVECVGNIDWERRMDHMQQHAGQHILSAAFADELGYNTISFHLGKEVCSIDIKTDMLSEKEAMTVEKLANIIIMENRPIETKWVTKEELSNYALRKELTVTNNIRLVIIPDFDYNGCGGTHPKSTGQVGAIEILHWEKQKKHTRVFFVCGKRVRSQLHAKHKIIQRLTSLLSVPQEQLVDATKRIIDQTKELEKTITDLQMQLIEFEATTFINGAENMGKYDLVKQIFENRPISEIQQLAKNITTRSKRTLVLFLNETVDKLQIVCARGDELSIQMNQYIKQVLPSIHGKGGGNSSIAQGGGDKLVSAEEFMSVLEGTLNIE